ncbi:MAG: sigma 54-interacting transcriptional regulator [Bacteroidetes bacterium]|nr:sigma 54-interacting transcriptional regulator [Bacteroidota bacterium]MBS1630128.1 sigma 54-interacting transcriptional regulator [Bacteroidota bacterium]
MEKPEIKTLGALRASGYQPKGVKVEVRDNLVQSIRKHQGIFQGIIGYEDSVIPDLEHALLSRHNILFLGLRGQAKTRMAREMVSLLDEWIPIIAGSEINDDPYRPISHFAKNILTEQGEQTPIEWLHRSDRYAEKLATPDVSVSDLIGDVDPIKAANQRLSFADERALHFGIIPRSHRGIFVINELPDLQARIQVSLFNILQEGDIQIRGFKLRLPLDILFVFTANPEDYTNRGSIVTPLKDRIESQIITHYPKTIEASLAITHQEAHVLPEQRARVEVPELCKLLLEQIALEARKSEYVDQKSGVSARLTIAAFENLVSTAECRSLKQDVATTQVRIADFVGIIPAITGKIELVYEGEQEGPSNVAWRLLGLAIRSSFLRYFPDPQSFKKPSGKATAAGARVKPNPYQPIIKWFDQGHELQILQHETEAGYKEKLLSVDGLYAVLKSFYPKQDEASLFLYMEFLLHGLAEFSLISKKHLDTGGYAFGDILGGMLNMDFDSEDSDEE